MLQVRAQFKPRNNLGRFTDVYISPAVVAAVQVSCEYIQQTAQGYCPVDTGALRDSITIDPIDDQGKTIVGRVGPHMPYAEYVEYGTGRAGDPSAPYGHTDKPGMGAQPYMRPSVDEAKPVIMDIFRNNLEAALA